jgi:hypothetical protein
MASVIQQDVLRLEIPTSAQLFPSNCSNVHSPIYHVKPVQMLERQQQLGSVKPRPHFVELSLSLQMVEQLSTVHKRQDEVQLFFALEREFEWDDKRVVDLGQHCALGEGMSDFGPRDDVGFANSLEGVNSEGITFANLHDLHRVSDLRAFVKVTHLAERPLADDLEQLKAVNGERRALGMSASIRSRITRLT